MHIVLKRSQTIYKLSIVELGITIKIHSSQDGQEQVVVWQEGAPDQKAFQVHHIDVISSFCDFLKKSSDVIIWMDS